MPVKKGIVSKILKKVKSAAKKRYVTKTGKGLRVSQVMKDVALLKSMVNAEKKQLQYKSLASSPPIVGQVNGNSSGHFVMDITPVPSEGAASYQRNGGSIRWTSSYLEFMFNKTSTGNSGCTYIIEAWKVNNKPYTSLSDFMSEIFEPNGYITNNVGAPVSIYDTFASRDQDFYKNVKRVGYKKVYFPNNQISGDIRIQMVRMPLKLGHHVKYQSFQTGDTNLLASGQVILTIRADNGNSSTLTASTNLGVPITAINTGASFQWSHTHYYYDN